MVRKGFSYKMTTEEMAAYPKNEVQAARVIQLPAVSASPHSSGRHNAERALGKAPGELGQSRFLSPSSLSLLLGFLGPFPS